MEKFSRDPGNEREHIEQELKDSGISSTSEWRKAQDLETPLEGEKETEPDPRNFEKLLTYLESDKKISDKEKIKKFGETEDSIERLDLLRTMSIADAVDSIREYPETEGSYRYLANRLDFYQKFISGEATKIRTESEWDGKNHRYIQVTKEHPIDASGATPETVHLGLFRDIEFAAMIGTPELGIYKIAEKRLTEKNISKVHMPQLKGYHSGIDERSIGTAYPFLRTLYDRARKSIEHRKGTGKLTEQQKEHKAVLRAADWLEEAMQYNSPNRGPQSPFVSSLEEAIAWTRLGPQVKGQLRGMRQKISDIKLHNIGRFIGKSGVDKYDQEERRLGKQIKQLKIGYDPLNTKEKLTEKENDFALFRLQDWYERELERLQHRYFKRTEAIKKEELPEDEKKLRLDSINIGYGSEITKLQAEHETQSARLQSRTPEELLADLEQREVVVAQRHEKRKSLAQKAIDLHFRFNHPEKIDYKEYKQRPYTGLVDWINYAPLGTIKRSHKMLQQGIKEETIIEYALADIIAGKRGATREDLAVVHDMVSKARATDWSAKQKLEAMSKVGNILSLSNYEVSLEKVADLAGKNFHGMTEALKVYDLDHVEWFIDRGIILNSVTTTKKVTEKFGYNLESDVIVEIASHNIDGLDDSLRSFELDAVRALLKENIHLPTAVAVFNNSRQFGYELTIEQVAKIAKNVDIRSIQDFSSALRGLPLPEVERLFAIGIPYHEFGTVQAALKKHSYPSDFNASLSVAQKLARNSEYSNLDRALDAYSLSEIDQISNQGIALNSALEVKEVLKEKGVVSDLKEALQFTKYATDSHYNVGDSVKKALEIFQLDGVRKIVSSSCKLDMAIEVSDYITTGKSHRHGYWRSDDERNSSISESLRESLKKGGLDVVIAIAKAGNMEIAVKTIEAGFTIEEITRFPYLISSLVTKRI